MTKLVTNEIPPPIVTVQHIDVVIQAFEAVINNDDFVHKK